MSAFDIVLLIIIGVWLYSRCCQTEAIRQIQEHLDEIELHQLPGPDTRHAKAAHG